MFLKDFDTIFALGAGLNLSYLVFPQVRDVIVSLALSPVEESIRNLDLWLEDLSTNPEDRLYRAIYPQVRIVKRQLDDLKKYSASLALRFSYASFAFSLLCIVFLYYCVLEGQSAINSLKLKLFTVFSIFLCFVPFIFFSLALWVYLFSKRRAMKSRIKLIEELIKSVEDDVESIIESIES